MHSPLMRAVGSPRSEKLDPVEPGDNVRPYRNAFVILAVFLFAAVPSFSQTGTNAGEGSDPGYFASWFKRVDKTQAEQPHWATPLATTTPRPEEEFRLDIRWQTTHSGITTENDRVREGLRSVRYPRYFWRDLADGQ